MGKYVKGTSLGAKLRQYLRANMVGLRLAVGTGRKRDKENETGVRKILIIDLSPNSNLHTNCPYKSKLQLKTAYFLNDYKIYRFILIFCES